MDLGGFPRGFVVVFGNGFWSFLVGFNVLLFQVVLAAASGRLR